MIKYQERQKVLSSMLLAISPVLVMPIGLCVGTLFGIIGDFGFNHPLDRILRNPDIFAEQYGPAIVFNGWFCVAVVIMTAAVVGISLICRFRVTASQPDTSKSA